MREADRRDVVRDLPDHLPVATRFDEELPRSLVAVGYSNHSDVEHDRSIVLIETNGHDACVAWIRRRRWCSTSLPEQNFRRRNPVRSFENQATMITFVWHYHHRQWPRPSVEAREENFALRVNVHYTENDDRRERRRSKEAVQLPSK